MNGYSCPLKLQLTDLEERMWLRWAAQSFEIDFKSRAVAQSERADSHEHRDALVLRGLLTRWQLCLPERLADIAFYSQAHRRQGQRWPELCKRILRGAVYRRICLMSQVADRT